MDSQHCAYAFALKMDEDRNLLYGNKTFSVLDFTDVLSLSQLLLHVENA